MLPECFAALVVFDWSLDPMARKLLRIPQHLEWAWGCTMRRVARQDFQCRRIAGYGDGSKPWYLVTKWTPSHSWDWWMFIPLKMDDYRYWPIPILQLVPQSQKYLRQLPHRPILIHFAIFCLPKSKLSSEFWWTLIIREFLGDEHNRNPHQSRRCEKPGASSRGAGFERRQRSKCIPWRVCVRTQRPFDLSKPFVKLNWLGYIQTYPDWLGLFLCWWVVSVISVVSHPFCHSATPRKVLVASTAPGSHSKGFSTARQSMTETTNSGCDSDTTEPSTRDHRYHTTTSSRAK